MKYYESTPLFLLKPSSLFLRQQKFKRSSTFKNSYNLHKKPVLKKLYRFSRTGLLLVFTHVHQVKDPEY